MRKFLDRSRSIPLHGRPITPNWQMLIYIGVKAVTEGRADTAVYLESVMWEGTFPDAIEAKPATFQPSMIDQWLQVDEQAACTLLREQWGMLRAPETREEALTLINATGCFDSDLGSHRLTAAHATMKTPEGEWAVGHCRDCTEPLLWHFPSQGTVRTWPFYPYH